MLISAAILTLLCTGQNSSHVTIQKTGSQYMLKVDGKPFFVKGAGGDASKKLLSEVGGNSFRTWGVDNLGERLDEAQKNGLKVAAGFWMGHEEHGFKYSDPAAVKRQLEEAKTAFRKYKDHPALLLWAVGNEMEGFGSGDNPAIWKAVEDVAKAAKEIDPNHPTMTVIAEVGGNKVKSVHQFCPSIDIVGINSYGGGATVGARYKAAGGTKPFMVTEFGPAGVWEVAKNAWGVCPELTSTEKVAAYRATYNGSILGQKDLCLGSYVFAWGNKQEATATWFGMLLPDGSRLAAVDAMQELWSGKPPKNRCPEIRSLKLDGPAEVGANGTIEAKLDVVDPEGDPLKVQWVLQKDNLANGQNGDSEAVPPTFPEAIVTSSNRGATVKLPLGGTAYRLFAYVRDNHGGAAVGNIPVRATGSLVVASGPKAVLPYAVYEEAGKPFGYIPSGFMGDYGNLKVNPGFTGNPHDGKTCMEVAYTAGAGWAGIAWQSPEGDWGDKSGGKDLTGAKRLSFWARGKEGGEAVTFSLGLIDKNKPFFDTAKKGLPKTTLESSWKHYTIDLAGENLKRIKTGFVLVVAPEGKPITFYLDDIRYE